MEERRFDEFTRVLGAATSRRQLIKGAIGAAVGAVLVSVGVRTPQEAEAAAPLCNGVPYVPGLQCCEPAGIQPVYPIADLALCPNRVPHPGHVPDFNGCGPANGFISHLIPNRVGPTRNVDFTPACNNHDICYDTCNTEKSTCDQNFLADMRAACVAAYPGSGYFDRYMRTGCYADAYIYYLAVSRTSTGLDAYESAQKEACDCCAICQECGGRDDVRCCQGVCHDPCPEGQQRNPDTCACDPCLGQPDGTVCGTNEVCCQEGCVSDQCSTGKSFSYGSCGCVCDPVECAANEMQDPVTCVCVNTCDLVECGTCQTCDPNSGTCVSAANNTDCGNGNVCCNGACQADCTCTGLPCSNGDCCANNTDFACCEDGCCPQVQLPGSGEKGAECLAPGSQTFYDVTAGSCCQPDQLMKLSVIDPTTNECSCTDPGASYGAFCAGNMPTDILGAPACSCGPWFPA